MFKKLLSQIKMVQLLFHTNQADNLRCLQLVPLSFLFSVCCVNLSMSPLTLNSSGCADICRHEMWHFLPILCILCNDFPDAFVAKMLRNLAEIPVVSCASQLGPRHTGIHLVNQIRDRKLLGLALESQRPPTILCPTC